MTDETEPPKGAEPSGEEPAPPRGPLRKMILRQTAALPVLVTLLNGAAGFAAIHYAAKDGLGNATIAHLSGAAWLIFGAMVLDALDGRLARMTRQATDFGAQLDSLCDAISFGVAPAVLMVQTVSMAVKEDIFPFDVFDPHGSMLGKAIMAVAVLYVCCTVLRLARFNIENAPDLLHHMEFKGLPTPGAAALVASLVLLFDRLQVVQTGPMSATWLRIAVGVALPAGTLAVALLMVSRFPYPHPVNRLVTGKKPFSYIVITVVVLISALMFLQLVLAAAAVMFAVAGPVAALSRKIKPPPPPEGES